MAAAASYLASPCFRGSLFAIHRPKPVDSQKSSNKPLNHCRWHACYIKARPFPIIIGRATYPYEKYRPRNEGSIPF